MIGPGWMPSRPRPLGRARHRLVSPVLRPRAARRSPAAPAASDAVVTSCRVLSRQAKLPVATLLPSRHAQRPSRVLTSALHRWLCHRWLWVQPRLIPLIVASIGLVGVLNARRYLLDLARGPAMVCAPQIRAAAAPTTPDQPAPVSCRDHRALTL